MFPGTAVTYTYTATNTGTTDLRNDTGNAGWVTDNQCSPVTQVVNGAGDNVGDTNADDLLNPGETWQFTCSGHDQRPHHQPGHDHRPARRRAATRSGHRWSGGRSPPCAVAASRDRS